MVCNVRYKSSVHHMVSLSFQCLFPKWCGLPSIQDLQFLRDNHVCECPKTLIWCSNHCAMSTGNKHFYRCSDAWPLPIKLLPSVCRGALYYWTTNQNERSNLVGSIYCSFCLCLDSHNHKLDDYLRMLDLDRRRYQKRVSFYLNSCQERETKLSSGLLLLLLLPLY